VLRVCYGLATPRQAQGRPELSRGTSVGAPIGHPLIWGTHCSEECNGSRQRVPVGAMGPDELRQGDALGPGLMLQRHLSVEDLAS